uniref:hypothetical protein n=1 Tax=Streptomyces sp. NBC_01001 TaxID=2903713 RepID=UPI002F9195B7
ERCALRRNRLAALTGLGFAEPGLLPGPVSSASLRTTRVPPRSTPERPGFAGPKVPALRAG